jgi:hypothetical protein
MEKYDSEKDTLLHKKRVAKLLNDACVELLSRADKHDNSKLEGLEKSVFDEFTPKLKSTVYGSEEYNVFLDNMGIALKHHYNANSHHPEHFDGGINDMDLFDILEMFCDWKAASERHSSGSIFDSFEINEKRFGMSDQLKRIFINTAIRIGFKK